MPRQARDLPLSTQTLLCKWAMRVIISTRLRPVPKANLPVPPRSAAHIDVMNVHARGADGWSILRQATEGRDAVIYERMGALRTEGGYLDVAGSALSPGVFVLTTDPAVRGFLWSHERASPKQEDDRPQIVIWVGEPTEREYEEHRLTWRNS